MSNGASTDWLSTLPQKASLYTLVFLQLGHAGRDLSERLSEVPGAHLTVKDYLSAEAERPEDLCFLHDFDWLRLGRGERLGALRDRVTREASQLKRFVFVSRAPKTAYPDARGSDVIADAKQVFPPLEMYTTESATETADQDAPQFYAECVRELGDRTVIALSAALWESHLSPRDALESLPRLDIEALRGAGLVRVEGVDVTWSVSGKQFKQVKQAVALVCSESTTAREWVPDSFVEVWTLERALRNAIRLALMEKMGDGWRETCLPEHLRNEVLERAQRDSHPRATKLGDLRDPLEWLSTSELLDLRESRELGGLGLEPYLWTKLRNEIVPIRNKIAHMRLVNEQDAQRAAMWRQLVIQRTT